MLHVQNLTKIYKGGKTAVDNLSLWVKPGKICGFIGQNGAGKTTTLKCIAGILDFKDGDISINGQSIKDDPIECKKIIAYVPDNPEIYENLTGIQYLNFIGNIYQIEKGTRNWIMKEYADMFELTGALGSLISSYSHGMKQKLVLIGALMHKPKLLLLDEPFVGLDPVATHKLKDVMKSICAQGASIFFSTHVLDVAQKLCDEMTIIKSGRLVITGETNQIIGNKSLEDLFLELVE